MSVTRQHIDIPMKVFKASLGRMSMIKMDMAQGKSVHIKGLGYFHYTLDTVGVENLEDFDFEKHVKAVRVEFIPERTRLANGTYTRALVDSDQLEWIELSPDKQDSDPAQDDDAEDVTENPLGKVGN